MGVDPEIAFRLGFIAILLICALTDFWLLRIPNLLVLFLIALFGIAAWYKADQIDIWQHLIVAGVVFCLGAGLFFLNQFGGGDVKLLAATTLWTGFSALPLFLMSLGIAAIVLVLLYRYARLPMAAAADYLEHASGGRFPAPRSLSVATHIPYGIVIAAAAVVTSGEIALLR